MIETEGKKLVIDIINTIIWENWIIDYLPPLKEAAFYFLKEEKQFFKTKKEFRKQYLKITEDIVSSEKFQTKKKSVDSLVRSLMAELIFGIPDLKDAVKYSLSFEMVKGKIPKAIILELFTKQQVEKKGKVTVIKMPHKYVNGMFKQFLKLGKALIRQEIINEVEREALINGEYRAVLEFTSVPNACKHYKNENGNYYELKGLKDWIKEWVIIYEGEDILEDWGKINKRINSWNDHESEKYKKN